MLCIESNKLRLFELAHENIGSEANKSKSEERRNRNKARTDISRKCQ